MKRTVLITSLATPFDAALAEVFAGEGWEVYAMGETPVKNAALLPVGIKEAAEMLAHKTQKLDYLLDTTDVRDERDTLSPGGVTDAAVIEALFRQNVLRSMALLEAFLPFLDEGAGKRLFYLTEGGASVNETRHTERYGYNMSKAALHQFIQMTRNKLAPKGYTFRVYDPLRGEVPPEAAAEGAYNYITRRRGTENHDPLRDDEDNLVYRDALGRQHCW
jgi:NAD(P)-dependent dehydrogenase (short-subunit alcohol dehydrogenase family)